MPVKVSKTPFFDYLRNRYGTQASTEKRESINWLRKMAQAVTRMRMPQAALNNRLGDSSPVGKMIMFNYDPKLKDKLPYYDTFPLVMVLAVGPKHMLGLNFHYLTPERRARLLDFFYHNAIKNSKDGIISPNSVSTLTYSDIKALASDRLIKPTIKKYLYDHMVTKPVVVNPEEWPVVIFLPTARWVGPAQGVI